MQPALTLYVRDNCIFSAMALHKVAELGLMPTIKNLKEPGVVDELVERGGKRQVPYLMDEDRGEDLYGSAEIVDYLDRNYPNPA